MDGNLITSRQPGDLAIFTTAILSRLGYGGKAAALPEETDPNADWWKLADSWGGSSKGEITQGLNTALAGERYAQEAFDQYSQKTSDEGLRNLLKEIIANKQFHIKKLEQRLNQMGEKPSLTANIADTYAKLKASVQGSDNNSLLRRALGDLQTGVVDIHNLRVKFTDPVATDLFAAIEKDLAVYEQNLVHLYRNFLGTKPAKPTTGPSVTA